MNFKEFMGKVGMFGKKYGPTIGIVTGVAGTLYTLYSSNAKTKNKLQTILNTANDDIRKCNEALELIDHTDPSDDELEKNLKLQKREIRKKELKDCVLLYLPEIIIETTSIALIFASHHVAMKRISQLGATVAVLTNELKSYRAEVKEELGAEKEKEIYNKSLEKQAEQAKETGNKPVTFEYLFDESNNCWVNSATANLEYLNGIEDAANRLLKSKKFLFLDEVYDMLGVDYGTLSESVIQGAHVVGWLYDPEDPTRDSHVSFGLKNPDGSRTEGAMNMIRNGETNIWLEFNIDGDITTGSLDKKTGRNKRTFMRLAQGGK